MSLEMFGLMELEGRITRIETALREFNTILRQIECGTLGADVLTRSEAGALADALLPVIKPLLEADRAKAAPP